MKGKAKGKGKMKGAEKERVTGRTLRSRHSGITGASNSNSNSNSNGSTSTTRSTPTRAAKAQALKSLVRRTDLTRDYTLKVNEQEDDKNANDAEVISVHVAEGSKRTKTKQSTNKVSQKKGKRSRSTSKTDDDESSSNEDSEIGYRPAKQQALKLLRTRTSKRDSARDEKKGMSERINASNLKSENSWEQWYKELVKFKEENGHCLVPKVYPKNRQLSYWVFRQRAIYSGVKKQSEKNYLSEERTKKLEDVGFIFKAKHSKEQTEVDAARRKPQLDAKWNKFYEEFIEYKKKTGSCLIPKVYGENQPLSSWLVSQNF